MAKNAGRIAIGALIGAAAGFIAGILTAPKSGKETRGDIQKTAVNTKKGVVKNASKLKGKAGNAAVDAVDKADKAVGVAADKVADTAKDVKSRSSKIARGAKRTIRKTK